MEKFKKEQKKNQERGKSQNNLNSGYTSKNGNTFGLYPRFYWDENDVPFGGTPGYKQTSVGLTGATAVNKKASKKGGRFSKVSREDILSKNDDEYGNDTKFEEPPSTSGFKFNR